MSCCGAIIPRLRTFRRIIMELVILSGIAAIAVIAIEVLDYAR
jgi:hypothetical protein